MYGSAGTAGPLPAAGVAHMKVPSVLTISIYFMVKFAHCVFCYSFATTTFRAKSELCHGIWCNTTGHLIIALHCIFSSNEETPVELKNLYLQQLLCKMETRISRVVCSQQGEKITCHLENLRQFSEQFNKLGEIMSQPVWYISQTGHKSIESISKKSRKNSSFN